MQINAHFEFMNPTDQTVRTMLELGSQVAAQRTAEDILNSLSVNPENGGIAGAGCNLQASLQAK